MNLYIMLDLETTAIDPRFGYIWEVGMVAFNNRYETVEEYADSILRTEDQWDPSALDWARKHYGNSLPMAETRATYNDERELLNQICCFIERQKNMYGAKNLYLICNHVEFDWVWLQYAGRTLDMEVRVEKLIHYQNKLDLQSLCRGKIGRHWDSEYKHFKEARPKVAHRALDDCYGQIGMLQWMGVELP